MTGLDLERPPRFGTARIVTVTVGLLLVAAAWWQIVAATADVVEVEVERGGVPITLLLPAVDGPAPGVVVAHGFAGSRQLMRSFGVSLAGAGYVVALPDLAGHGANRTPLDRDGDDDQLARDVLTALDVLVGRGEVDAGRVALLGHSMGSGAVLRAGLAAPERIRAVVAVSPTDADVTAMSPPNLLLLVGELEPRFVLNAESLLERGGGASDDVLGGAARELRVVPSVEHVSILFSQTAHREVVRWLDAATGRTPTAPPAAVWMMLWWLVHLVGVLVVWRAAAPVLVTRDRLRFERGRPLVGLLVGGVVATLVLAVVGAFGELGAVGGMLVGPTLSAWFLVAGAVWLRLGPRPGPPDGRDLLWGLLLLVVLVVAFGVLAPRVWSPWFPIPRRVAYIPLFGAALLPWTLAFAATLQDRRGIRALGWWVAVTLVVLLTLGAAANIVAGLGFLILVLPLLPLVLGLTQLVWAPVQRPWAAGIATAAFLGWTIATLFPLV